MKRIIILTLIMVAARLSAQDLSPVRIDFQSRIPTRDGIKLSAVIYQPTNMGNSTPVLFALTPYGTDYLHKDAYWFAQRGYTVVTVNCRGRGDSEGSFVPFEFDGKDGFDICKWISKKEWCNGSIGMFGTSYLGTAQWLVLREHPAGLKTIVPIAATAPGIDFPMFNNIFYTLSVQWLELISGRSTNAYIFNDTGYWNRVYETYFKHFVPFTELPMVAGVESNVFQKWLLHPDFDKYYKEILPNELEYKTASTSALTVTGYFDETQRGALYFHNNMLRYAHDSVKNGCYVIMGPWDHSGTYRPKANVGNLTFHENAAADMRQIQLEWFNWKLNSGPVPSFIQNKVTYYEMGVDQWRSADSLPQLSETTTSYFLRPVQSGENSLYNCGGLSTDPGGFDVPTEIRYNPLDTTMTQYRLQNGPVNYAWRDGIAATFPEKAVFQSAPLPQDIQLCGRVELNTFVGLNVPDADLEAILYEIQPDGTSIYLTSDIIRARYRNSLESAMQIVKKDAEEYHFRTFHFTCRTIRAGSRLRLVFGALNSPYYQKNYHTGLEVHLETAKVARQATIKIYHGKKFPSALVLPVKM